MTKEELKQEAEEWLRNNLHSASEEDFIKAMVDIAGPREKRIAELEKENAELKGLKDVATLIRANNDTVVTLMQLNNKLVSKSQQLTIAKDLIHQFLIQNPISDWLPKKAEQFLKEIEK